MTTRTCALLALLLALIVVSTAWTVLTVAHREDRAALWRCVSLIAEQPPETDVAEALERCRVMLAKKEMRP